MFEMKIRMKHDSEEYHKAVSNRMKTRWKNGVYNSDDYRKKLSEGAKKWIKEKGHPRGMLGKTQSEKAIRAVSEMCKKRLGDKHPNWKGGTQSYWNEIAREKTRHILNICVYCGKTKNILVHHKDLNIKNNKLDNLEKTCCSCHRKICHKESSLRVIELLNKKKAEKKLRENGEKINL